MDGKPKLNREPKRPRANRDTFVAEYARHGNGQRAAEAAGCLPHSARKTAAKWLTNADIKRRIRDEQDAASRAARISVARTLREIDNIADSDIGDVMDFSGDEIKERRACTINRRARRAIKKVKITTKTTTRTQGEMTTTTVERNVEIELWSKPDALEKLAKHQGLYLDQDDIKAMQDKLAAMEQRIPRHQEPSKN